MAAPPVWATSSHGEAAQTRPVDLATLGEHTAHCSSTNGRLASMRCGAGSLLGFVSARLVTTAALIGLLIAAVLMWS
ncbi:MAG: hypothetical protein IPG93_20940 [Burkholderiales bacterium]|nr:hypothetical protein [Burkholderiales bacterium]